MPSILCYEQLGEDSCTESFCLVKPDAVFEDEDAAVAMAEKHLEAADVVRAPSGSPQDFAISLRHEGYKRISDFRIVTSENR
jgi:hypothetical protein